MTSSSGNRRATRWINSRASPGRVRWLGSDLGRDAFFAGFFPFFAGVFPLVRPWRFLYRRKAMGRAKTLVGAQDGWTTIRQRTTQSCPQLTNDLARLEISGS